MNRNEKRATVFGWEAEGRWKTEKWENLEINWCISWLISSGVLLSHCVAAVSEHFLARAVFWEKLWIGRFGPDSCQVNKYWGRAQKNRFSAVFWWCCKQTFSLIYLWNLEWCKCVCVSLADLVSPDSPPTHTQTLTFPFVPPPSLFLPQPPLLLQRDTTASQTQTCALSLSKCCFETAS